MDPTESSDAAVTSVAERARQYGHHAGRIRYAGVAPDHEARTVTVYRVPDPGFDDEIRTLLSDDDVQVVLADAPHTREELTVARETVWAYAERLSITGISVPVDGSRILVTTDAPEAEVQAQLDLLVPGLARAASAAGVTL